MFTKARPGPADGRRDLWPGTNLSEGKENSPYPLGKVCLPGPCQPRRGLGFTGLRGGRLAGRRRGLAFRERLGGREGGGRSPRPPDGFRYGSSLFCLLQTARAWTPFLRVRREQGTDSCWLEVFPSLRTPSSADGLIPASQHPQPGDGSPSLDPWQPPPTQCSRPSTHVAPKSWAVLHLPGPLTAPLPTGRAWGGDLGSGHAPSALGQASPPRGSITRLSGTRPLAPRWLVPSGPHFRPTRLGAQRGATWGSLGQQEA